MAISEDTAALVAAQLTVAWASRMGPTKSSLAGQTVPSVLGTYRRIFESLQQEANQIEATDMAEWIESQR